MNLSEIRRVLSESGIQLTKSLGQNFLHDKNQLRKIVAAAELTGKDRVLEIGPGLGPLTELLLEHADEVLAIEKDARLFALLERRFGTTLADDESMPSASTLHPNQRLQLLCADALAFLRRQARDWTAWKMVSNLPYSVASPILVELAGNPSGPERMVATLQIEVARRLTAAPGNSDYGILTLLVQLDYEPSGFFKIPASCFFPEPDVDSACVCLVRRPRRLLHLHEGESFVRVVKQSFSQRRKMMLKLLKSKWAASDVEQAFRLAKLDPQVRAESVSLEQFVELARALPVGTKK